MRAMRAFLALIQAVVASLLEAVGQLAVAAAVKPVAVGRAPLSPMEALVAILSSGRTGWRASR